MATAARPITGHSRAILHRGIAVWVWAARISQRRSGRASQLKACARKTVRSTATCRRSGCRTGRRWNWSTTRTRSRGKQNMRKILFGVFGCAILINGVALAQRHPDLSGIWTYAIDRAPAALRKEVNGVVTIQKIDQSARHGDASSVRGVLPFAEKPSYKPQFMARVKELSDH